jgi:F-type H+-transporting ATPase subunit b
VSLIGVVALALEEAAEVHGETGTLPQLDAATWPSQLFWLALTFGVLYLLMDRFFLPRLGAAIEERRDRIADDLDQAAEGRRKAEEAERAYKAALADATARSRAIAAEARAAMEADLAEIAADADRRANEALAAAERRIAAMKADAARKVEEAAVDTTRAIVATLLDETPTAEQVAQAMRAKAA